MQIEITTTEVMIRGLAISPTTHKALSELAQRKHLTMEEFLTQILTKASHEPNH